MGEWITVDVGHAYRSGEREGQTLKWPGSVKEERIGVEKSAPRPSGIEDPEVRENRRTRGERVSHRLSRFHLDETLRHLKTTRAEKNTG